MPCAAPYATWNNATQYFNGTYYLGYYSGWNISSSANISGGFSLYSGPGDSPLYAGTSFPLTGWSVGTGTAPAPTFAKICPQLTIGVQTTISPNGTDAPTSLNMGSFPDNGWEIVNPAGTVIAWAERFTTTGNPSGGISNNMNGWYTSATFPYTQNSTTGAYTITSFPLTPPIGTPIDTGYEVRAIHDYVPASSAYFDVVALPVRRNQTRIIMY